MAALRQGRALLQTRAKLPLVLFHFLLSSVFLRSVYFPSPPSLFKGKARQVPMGVGPLDPRSLLIITCYLPLPYLTLTCPCPFAHPPIVFLPTCCLPSTAPNKLLFLLKGTIFPALPGTFYRIRAPGSLNLLFYFKDEKNGRVYLLEGSGRGIFPR